MKKNKPMRTAGLLLLAVLLTTCMTAGTFAKYTTGNSASDNARVAKFGVVVSADGSLFGKEYASDENDNEIIAYSDAANTGTVQVSASTGSNVVAPGTKNDTGLGFGVTGTPEVDVELTYDITAKNVYLTAGTYGVMVEIDTVTSVNFVADDLYVLDAGAYTHPTAYDAGATYYVLQDAVTLTADYYPVVYSLAGTTEKVGTYTSDSLAEIASAIETNLGTSASIYQANTNLATKLSLDSQAIIWEWAYENGTTDDEKAMYDGADTILGDLAAAAENDTTFIGTVVKLDADDTTYKAPTGAAADATDAMTGYDYNLYTAFDMAITVTQVD